MFYYIILIFLTAAILLPLSYLIYTIWNQRINIKSAYKKMISYERVSFNVGLYLYFAVPILKGHSSSTSYLGGIVVDILLALASALFVLGALAFIKHYHSLYENDKKTELNNKPD